MDESINKSVNKERIVEDIWSSMLVMISHFRRELEERICGCIKNYKVDTDKFTKLIEAYSCDLSRKLSSEAEEKLNYISKKYGDILAVIKDHGAERKIKQLARTWTTMHCLSVVFEYKGEENDSMGDVAYNFKDIVTDGEIWSLFCKYVIKLDHEIDELSIIADIR